MKILFLSATILFCFSLTACSRENIREGEGSNKKMVMLYGTYHEGSEEALYYGEDTRGELYVVEKGALEIPVHELSPLFVQISQYRGKWFVDKVLSRAS